jgi:hypothetical protein
VVTATALVVIAALVVLGAVLPSLGGGGGGSVMLVSGAAVLALVLGAAAAKILHSELLDSRRRAAHDRARQAQAYRELTAARSTEHDEFVTAMEARLGAARRTTVQLESAVVGSQGRAAEAMRKLGAEARRADLAEQEGVRLAVALEESEERAAEAIVRVAELEQDNDVLRSELAAGSWQPHIRHA